MFSYVGMEIAIIAEKSKDPAPAALFVFFFKLKILKNSLLYYFRYKQSVRCSK